MSLKKIQLICEVLTEQMNHWMLFPIALTIMEMTRGQTGMEKPDMLLWVLCSLFPLLFFVLRTHQGGKRRIRFLLLSIAAAAAYTFVLVLMPRPLIGRGICAFCGAGYLLHSLILKLKKDVLYTAAIQLPVAVVLSLVSTFMRHTNQWNHYYTFSLIAVTAMFFIVFYMRQYLDYISLNMSSAGHLPIGEIFRSGTGLAAAYTLLGVMILIISVQHEWLAKLLKPVADFLVQLLRFLLSKILPKKVAVKEDMPLWEKEPVGIQSPQLPEPNEAFWLWKVLEVMFTLALLVGMVYVAVRLLLKLLALLQEYLNRRVIRPGTEDPAVSEVREKCDIRSIDGRRQRRALSEALTNKERVRRLYKRKILSCGAKLIGKDGESRSRLGLSTAREWEERLQAAGMAGIYERARYSRSEVTADDVKRMRAVCSERKPEQGAVDVKLKKEPLM